jgi:hypothetical protein
MSISDRLSADQLVKAVPGSVFYRYPDLRKFSSIDQLLSQSSIEVVFLLYLIESENSGHFCCVFRSGDIITFFDPYGLCCDSELSYVRAGLRKSLGEDVPVLLSLLVKGSQTENWTYNSWDLQRHDPAVQDCGRWCILRAVHRDMNDDEFHAFVKQEAKKDGNDLDAACVRLTQPLL